MMDNYVWPIVIIATVSVICATTLFSCANSNESYYRLADNCVKSGGSWVPQGHTGSYSGMCILPGTKVVPQ